MKKVMPGDAVEIRAQTWNSFIDAANYVKMRQSESKSASKTSLPVGMIYVRNDSGEDMEMFSAMSLPDLVFSPEDDEDDFRFSNIVFSAETATGEDDGVPLCILQQPLSADEVGRALVLGVTHGKVNVSDPSHRFAVPSPDEPGGLISSESGSIEIMWKGEETGEQDCILKMGGSGAAGDFSYPFQLFTDSDEEGNPVLCMKPGRVEIQTVESLGVNFRFGESDSFREEEKINFDFASVPDGIYLAIGWIRLFEDGSHDCGILIGSDEDMNSSYEYPEGCGFFTFTIGVVEKTSDEEDRPLLAVKRQLACGTFSITDRYFMLPFVPAVEVELPDTSVLATAGSVLAKRAQILNAPCYSDSVERFSNLSDTGTSLERGTTYYAYIEETDNVAKIVWETEEKAPYETPADNSGPKIKRTLAAKLVYESDGNFRTYLHHLAPYRGGGDTYKVKINNQNPHADDTPDFLEIKLQGDASSDADKEKYPEKGYIKHIVMSDEETPNNYHMKSVWDYKGITGYSDSDFMKTLVTVKGNSTGEENPSATLKWDDYGKIRTQESDERPGYLKDKVTAGRNVEFVWNDNKLKIESRSLMAGTHIKMEDKHLDDGHRYTIISALPPHIAGGKYITVTRNDEDPWSFAVSSTLDFSIAQHALWLLSLTDNDGSIVFDTTLGPPPETEEYFLCSDDGMLKWKKGAGKVMVSEEDEPDYLEDQFEDSEHIEFLSDGDVISARIQEDAFDSPSGSINVEPGDTFTLDVDWSQVQIDSSLAGLIDIEYLEDGGGVRLKSALSGNGLLVVENGNISILEGQANCLLACTENGFSWIPYSDCANACEE